MASRHLFALKARARPATPLSRNEGGDAAAAVCTTGANLPQLKKAWTRGQTDDIAMNMPWVLASGLALWVTYGVLQKDIVIILANAISLALISGLVWLKLQTSS